ncbi:MAG TPA: hypothetical protein VJ488_01650 [Dehalococcoidia bacterium]|nr:hypothetical protein [Dehalococcoidia bacterium]
MSRLQRSTLSQVILPPVLQRKIAIARRTGIISRLVICAALGGHMGRPVLITGNPGR